MRLIDADALHDMLQNLAYDDWNQGVCTSWANAFDECADIVEDAPTIELQWIPCSERLPEDYENVLVYFEYYRYGDYNCMFSTYGIGNYSSEYDSWLVNGETGWRNLHVFAWLPLPEPYEEVEE